MGLSSPSEPEWVSGLPLIGPPTAGLRLELAVRPAGEESAPFVTLSDAGRFSRVLLGRVAVGDGDVLAHVALKIQKDHYRPFDGGLGAVIQNPEIDAMWRREIDDLRQAACPDVVAPFDFVGGAARIGPITYCTETRAFFRPLGPDSTAPLEVCRDDDVLRQGGLERYSTSTERFLRDSAGVAAARPTSFYTWSSSAGERANGSVKVRRRTELYRDWAALFERDLPAEVTARLEREFPCWTCPERGGCYARSGAEDAAILAERRLWPVAYYDSFLVATEVLDLHFDEFCDLLGGATWRDAEQLGRGMDSAGRREVLAPVERALGRPGGFAFRLESGRRFALEVLFLKLQVLCQVGRGLCAYHARCDRPHLAVSPDNVMVRVPDLGPGSPVFWHFRAKLLDLGAHHRLAPPGPLPADLPEILVPCADAVPTYRSPFSAAGLGAEVPMRLTIERAGDAGDAGAADGADGARRLRVSADAPRARLSEYCPGDVVRIAPNRSLPGSGDQGLYGVIEETRAGGAVFSVFLAAGQSLAAGDEPLQFDGSVAFYKRSHAPCDLYGFGMLLCRALLCNDQRDVLAVEDSVKRVRQKLTLEMSGGQSQPPDRVVARLQALMQEEGAPFDAGSLLFQSADRADPDARVPEPIWSELLLLAFRMLTDIAGFGLCATHGDYDRARPGGVMERVLDRLGRLSDGVRVELFAERARSREISGICEEMTREINKLLLGGAGGHEAEAAESQP